MKKIFTSILISIFIILVIRCRYNINEEDMIPMVPLGFPQRSAVSLDVDCEYSNQIEEGVSIQDQSLGISTQNHLSVYTEEELHQLRHNLVGTYQGTIRGRNSQISFQFLSNHIPIIQNIRLGQYFVVNLLCLRNFIDGDTVYSIIFRPGSHTDVVGLSAISNDCLVAYFSKLETNEIQSHDEF